MKTTKLTQAEKYVIQSLLFDKKTVEEIAGILDRKVKTIQTFIDGPLNETHTLIAKIYAERVMQNTPQEILNQDTPVTPPTETTHKPKYHAIMTKELSERGDDTLKQTTGLSNRNIYLIREGKMNE